MTTLQAGSATDVGRLRTANQDLPLIVASSDLFGVADGMGGHQGGEVASALAVETLQAEPGDATLEGLKEAVRRANRVIFERAGGDMDLRGMGTTLCAIRVVGGPEGDEIAWVNVGDSRVYLLRDDRFIQLSQDHSLVEDLLRDGQLTEDEAAVHPQRNIVTRALGIDVDVEVDGETVLPFNGDRFLMCSDGLFNEVSEDQITAVLRRLADPGEAADELVRLANEGGGRDNITVVVVEVTDDDGRSAAASAVMAQDDDITRAMPLASVAPPPGSSAASGDDQPGAAPVAPIAGTPAGAGADGEPTTQLASGPATRVPPVEVDGGAVFTDRRSSLPDASDGYDARNDDFFSDLGKARTRRITWRVLAFLVVLALIGVVVAGVIGYSARNTYFVGFNGDRVAVYRGRPGGVLIFDPSLEQTTKIQRDELSQDLRDRLDAGKVVSSADAATRYLVFLRSAVTDAADSSSTSTTTAPAASTTVPLGGPTTTAAPVTTTTP